MEMNKEQLLAALKDLDIQEAKVLNETIKTMTPKVIESPDFSGLVKLCEDYVKEHIENDGCVDDDFDNWLSEAALQTIMGKDVFKQLNEITKLKKRK